MNKYIEQAKQMILSRYVKNRATPDHVISGNELLDMKIKCKNPKIGEALLPAIQELISEGFVYESGLGIHLTQKGYDEIF